MVIIANNGLLPIISSLCIQRSTTGSLGNIQTHSSVWVAMNQAYKPHYCLQMKLMFLHLSVILSMGGGVMSVPVWLLGERGSSDTE